MKGQPRALSLPSHAFVCGGPLRFPNDPLDGSLVCGSISGVLTKTSRLNAAMNLRKIIFLVASLATPHCVTPTCTRAAELTIENSPGKIPDGSISAELRGVRVVTTSPMFLGSASNGVTIPEDVVVAAVTGSPDLQKTLKLYSLSDLTFPKIAGAARIAQKAGVKWEPSNKLIAGVYCSKPKTSMDGGSWEHLTCDTSAKYNSDTVIQLLMRDGFDTTGTFKNDIYGRPVELIPVRQSYAYPLIAGNIAADNLMTTYNRGGDWASDYTAAYHFNNVINNGASSEGAKSVAFLNEDTVTFGTPIVESANEAQLRIPKEIANRFDVYLIQLAMTWRELPRNDLDELGFSVHLPTDTIALALMPFRYGITVNEKNEMHPSPSVELDGVKVELGEVYGRDISFSYLRPTIQAYGLQESEFSWSMRDEAIQPGAQQFLCAVGVPRHSRELTLGISATAHWSGGWRSAAGIESTDEKLTKITLQ